MSERVSIYVGNLPYGVMEAEVRALFSGFGPVVSVRLMMDWGRGRFRGFGFVEMASGHAQDAIRALHESEFQGRRIRVTPARKADEARQPMADLAR